MKNNGLETHSLGYLGTVVVTKLHKEELKYSQNIKDQYVNL